MQTLRIFYALPVPDSILASLSESLHKLPLHWDNYRLIDPENIHITLKFIGEVPVEKLPGFIQAAERVAPVYPAIELTTGPCILLPKNRPGVLAVEIAETPDLVDLYHELEDELGEQGLSQPDNRRFRPHITLARSRGAHIPPEDIDVLRRWSPNSFFGQADEMILFESVLQPQGATYNPLITCSFNHDSDH